MALTTYEGSSIPHATTRCGEPVPRVFTRLPTALTFQSDHCSRIWLVAYASRPGETRSAIQLCTSRPSGPSESVDASSCAVTGPARVSDISNALQRKCILDLLDEPLLVPVHEGQGS